MNNQSFSFPERIDGYTFVREIGSGAFGKVGLYKKEDSQVVAVKLED